MEKLLCRWLLPPRVISLCPGHGAHGPFPRSPLRVLAPCTALCLGPLALPLRGFPVRAPQGGPRRDLCVSAELEQGSHHTYDGGRLCAALSFDCGLCASLVAHDGCGLL